MDNLEPRLKVLTRDAEDQMLSLQKVPSWLREWKSPWKGKMKGGELISKGEIELYDLGIRIRENFPDVFNEEYHPDVYAIRATQVSRSFSFLSFNHVKVHSFKCFLKLLLCSDSRTDSKLFYLLPYSHLSFWSSAYGTFECHDLIPISFFWC